MPEFQTSIDLCKTANPMWIKQLAHHFGSMTVGVLSLEDNMKFQRNKWGDFLVILDFEDNASRYVTVETKVHELKYFNRYMLNGKSILFETMGNISIQKKGSAFLDSKADIYATAYMNNTRDGLLGVNLFHVKDMQTWVAANQHRYNKIISSTGDLYHTEFILVPRLDIPLDCICVHSYV